MKFFQLIFLPTLTTTEFVSQSLGVFAFADLCPGKKKNHSQLNILCFAFLRCVFKAMFCPAEAPGDLKTSGSVPLAASDRYCLRQQTTSPTAAFPGFFPISRFPTGFSSFRALAMFRTSRGAPTHVKRTARLSAESTKPSSSTQSKMVLPATEPAPKLLVLV